MFKSWFPDTSTVSHNKLPLGSKTMYSAFTLLAPKIPPAKLPLTLPVFLHSQATTLPDISFPDESKSE